MSNNGVRIVLDRQDGGRWHWTLTAKGEQHSARRSEPSAELAAQAAETFRGHLNLFKERRATAAIHREQQNGN